MDRYREAVTKGTLAEALVPQCLWTFGLVTHIPGRPDWVAPVPAPIAAAGAVAPHEQEVAQHRRAIEGILRSFSDVELVYTEAVQERRSDITLLQGEEAITQTIGYALDNCTQELVTAQPGGGRRSETLSQAIEQSLAALNRGVRQRTLYQHSVRAHPPTLEYIRAVCASGAQVRTLDEMFDRLIICDQTVAFVPTSSTYENEALEIRQPAVVRFLWNVFEHAWSRGIEVVPTQARTSPDVAKDLERALIRMLIAGNTEDKIARDLGLSRRTVAEYTSRLSRRVGSRSRAQLGYLIATKGLLDEINMSGDPTPV